CCRLSLSSRRRHTRFSRDWSSDVCSSDLVNKMDRTGANFDNAVQTMVSRLGANAVPVTMPIGAERSFQGVIDLVEMKAYIWDEDDAREMHVGDVPPELLAEATARREKMIEAVAEFHDPL